MIYTETIQVIIPPFVLILEVEKRKINFCWSTMKILLFIFAPVLHKGELI